jgi:hypothetical protein
MSGRYIYREREKERTPKTHQKLLKMKQTNHKHILSPNKNKKKKHTTQHPIIRAEQEHCIISAICISNQPLNHIQSTVKDYTQRNKSRKKQKANNTISCSVGTKTNKQTNNKKNGFVF